MVRGPVALVTTTAAILLVLWSLPRLSQPTAAWTAWPGEPQFSARGAWAHAETLATRFPRRWSGSPDRQAAADWIATTLESWGLDVHRSRFEVALGERHPTTLENIWAISPGTDRADEIIVALGNYDMAPTSVQAASDTAGHVGTILELARVLHGSPHRRTILFLFPDGEEWGMLGARHFAQTFPDRHHIVAAVSIEDLDASAIAALGIDGIGQFRGFAPMWLRTLAADAARREDLPTAEVTPPFEWLQRSVLVSFTDQGPFLTAGIPAIDLGGRTADRATQNRIYHLPEDTMDKMRPQSMEIYGRTQERILRAIDAAPEVPIEDTAYLRIAPGCAVTRATLLAVQIAVFAPLVLSILDRQRRTPLGLSARDESIRLGAVLAVMGGGFAVLKILPRLGLMADFALYPPPPRHPLLTEVNWTAVTLVLLAVCAFGWTARRVTRRLAPGAVAMEPDAAVTVLLGWLLGVAALALIDNPFGAVTFLIFPALLWVWITPARSSGRRAANAVLIAAGFVALIALVVSYGQRLRVGLYIGWYLFMSVAYGQISLLRVLMTLVLVAVAVRLASHTVVRTA